MSSPSDLDPAAAARLRPAAGVPSLGVGVGVLGGLVALTGTYWDDAWHTDRGRDAFLAPPHLVLYAGVTVAIAGILVVAGAVRGARPGGLVVGIVGGAAVLVSAPIDEAWHAAFGRDAVLWSPPHLFAVAASVMLACGVLAVAVASQQGRALVTLAAVGVIGALQVPVLEFDSDVPQFPGWTYLPVAVAGWLVAAAVIESVAGGPRLLLRAALAYTALRAVIALGLVGLDHSTSVVPPVLLLVGLRELERKVTGRVGWAFQAGAGVLAWALWLAVAGEAATEVGGRDVVVACLLATAAGLAVSGVARGAARAAVVAVAVVVAALASPLAGEAAAHDPGQGDELVPATLSVTRTGSIATVRLDLRGGCTAVVPSRVVARRAGITVTGPLRATGSCRFEGQLAVDRSGRWFVYAELADGSGPLELWAPLDDTEDEAAVERSAYRPAEARPGGVVAAAGVLLYAASLGGVAWAGRRVAATARGDQQQAAQRRRWDLVR